MPKIIIEGASVAEIIAIALSMQGGSGVALAAGGHSVTLAASGDDEGPEDNGPVNTSAPAFDSAGLPWDARIHSSTKELNADGTWRKRRKSKGQPDDATIAAVEAELRAQRTAPMPQMTQQPVIQQMPDMSQQQTQPMVQQQPMQQMQTQPMVQQQPMQQVMQQPVQQQPMQQVQPQMTQFVVPADFGSFMQALSRAMQQQRVDQNYLAEVSAAFGMTAITDLAAQPGNIPAVVQRMINDQRWVG